MMTEQSRYRRAAAFSSPEALPGPLRGTRPTGEGGFTLVEVLICTLVLTIGMIAIAALLAVTTQMQIGAREAARSTRLAQDKIDELMKLDFEDDPEVAVGGDLDADTADHAETPLTGITLRWLVAAGPTDDTRVLTVRVRNLRAQQYRQTDLATIIREW
jgi:type II secretory pathway pseudopilin PulG